jgi:hypothetical protein
VVAEHVFDDQQSVFRVCEQCLEAGDIDKRIAEHAALLEQRAQWLRSIVGQVRVPTYAEWSAKCVRYDQEHCRDDEAIPF